MHIRHMKVGGLRRVHTGAYHAYGHFIHIEHINNILHTLHIMHIVFDTCFPGYELSDDDNEDIQPQQDGGSCDEIQPQHELQILPASASPILPSSPVPSHAP